MIEDVRALVDSYSAWLREKHALREVGADYVEITTPFVDRNNDNLQIFVRRHPDGFELTDAGETIAELKMSGCDIDTEHRSELLKATTNGFAVQVVKGELQTTATAQNFPLRKHNLIQAMLAVDDMFHLSAPSVAGLFLEDVERWLVSSEIPFLPDILVHGKSGFDQHFDFAIPASKTKPERLLKALANPTKQLISLLVFAWEDTRASRPPRSRCIAILNDQDRPVRASNLASLHNYDITTGLWTEREAILSELAA